MLKKIDCVLLKVVDLDEAAKLYTSKLGLRELWRDNCQIGLGMSDTDTEIVLHCDESIPERVNLNYLVDNVVDAVEILSSQGFKVLCSPFEIAIGNCAVIEDPLGQIWSILDMTKGPRNVKIPV